MSFEGGSLLDSPLDDDFYDDKNGEGLFFSF
jgi:hypothetical protein